jgi:hypothetical protein
MCEEATVVCLKTQSIPFKTQPPAHETLHAQNNETKGNIEFLQPIPLLQLMHCLKSVRP